MEACYGGTDVMERSCAVARGIDINTHQLSTFKAETTGVVIETCVKHPGGPTRITGTDLPVLMPGAGAVPCREL